jgi:hypothetical protein
MAFWYRYGEVIAVIVASLAIGAFVLLPTLMYPPKSIGYYWAVVEPGYVTQGSKGNKTVLLLRFRNGKRVPMLASEIPSMAQINDVICVHVSESGYRKKLTPRWAADWQCPAVSGVNQAAEQTRGEGLGP